MSNKLVLYEDINNSFSLDKYDIDIVNIEAINAQIINILTTIIGSRVKEPTFGSLVPDLLFDPVDNITAWKIETAMWDAIMTWMGDRLELDLAQSTVSAEIDAQTFTATVVYRLKSTNDPGTLSLKLSRLRSE